MIYTVIIIIKCLAALLVGVIAGNGAVYFFNKMPAKWLCDYGEEPTEELQDKYVQRVKSYPWKYIFSIFFTIIGIKLIVSDALFAAPAIIAIWILLEIAIADKKYMIIPDQLIIILAVTTLGFIPYLTGWVDILLGCLIGFGIMIITGFLGKVIYKKDALGGGDIKLFSVLGLMTGTNGIIAIFIMTTLFSSGHFIYELIRKTAKKGDTRPMGPYIMVSVTLYLVFLWGYSKVLYL